MSATFASPLKRIISWLQTWQGMSFVAILVFAAITRFWRLGYPEGYYFDEVYHVITAKLIAANDVRAYEWWHAPIEPGTAIDWLHPPLAKLMQALSINLIGNNSFAWRFSSALIGTLSIGAVYGLARALKLSQKTSLLAMLLLSLDGLSLTLSRITMNDAHVTFFIIMAVWMYVRWKDQPTLQRALITAITAGLACASKWSGIFVVGFFIVDLIRERIVLRKSMVTIQQSARLLLLTLILVPVIYLASYGQMFMQGKGYTHFKELHKQIIWYQTNLRATHPYQSTPLQWVTALRPLYAYTESSPPGKMANIYFEGNPLLFWIGTLIALIIATNAVAQTLQKFGVIRKTLALSPEKAGTYLLRRWKEAEQLYPVHEATIIAALAYLSTWILWIRSPRIMFFYHYTPAIPFLCILTAYGLQKLYARGGVWKHVVATSVLTIAVTFVVFFPNWTALTVPAEPFAKIYFALTSWR
jgi:dolichyl-phosphate-mannose-protein mannosyltransferase